MMNIRMFLYWKLGFQHYVRPKDCQSSRYWALWVWNEYGDWLFEGIHGFRILGLEFTTEPRWIDKACWKILPVIRKLVIRRIPIIPY